MHLTNVASGEVGKLLYVIIAAFVAWVACIVCLFCPDLLIQPHKAPTVALLTHAVGMSGNKKVE